LIFQKFKHYRSLGYPVSGPIMRLQAKRIAATFIQKPGTEQSVIDKYREAKFNSNWLDGFKARHNIRGRIRINGERGSLSSNIEELMDPIRDIIKSSGIGIQNIYNWDETGLFYRGLPRYTLATQDDDGAGSKEDKNRITVMLSVNGDGSDISLVVIGKSKTPRGCDAQFWNNQGVDYHANKKAWMNGDIFEKLLKKFDERMKQPTILLLDNFSGHSIEELQDFKHIIPIFLPANTTSETQPLDGGIIATCKVKYRLKLMNYILDEVDRNSFKLNNLTLHRIIPWLVEACKEIKPLTIQKCFHNTLKMDVFKPTLSEETISEAQKTFEALSESVQRYFGVDVRASEILEYATFDNVLPYVAINDIDSEDEDNIVIPDPKLFLEGKFTMAQLQSYFRETGCFRELSMIDPLIERLEKHLRFQ